MKHLFRLLALPLLLLGACEPKLEAPAPEGGGEMSADLRGANAAESRGDGRNPFSVAVMREALAGLRRPGKQPATTENPAKATKSEAMGGPVYEPPLPCRDCGPGGPLDIQPTHYYVRYRPTDPDQLADLADAGLELSLEPLDETVAAGTPPPDPSAEQIPWIYTAVPTDEPLPANVAAIPQERITELFLFTAEDGDAADEDPWVPQPPQPPTDCVPQWDPSCRCYTQCEQERPAARPGRRNRIKEATAQLKKAGISPLALYNEAMRLTLHADEQLDTPAADGVAQRGTRYYPSGTITVQQITSRNTGQGAVPLRRVEVRSRRWFNMGNARTDANGRFSINQGYRKEAKVIVQFKTERATTRGISPAMAPWGLVLPIRHQLGSYYKTQMQDLRYNFAYQSDINSKGALSWSAATLFNTIDDMYASCAATGIPTPPTDLNVMLLSHLTSGGSAPMLRLLTDESLAVTLVRQLLSPQAPGRILVEKIIQRQLPDITYRYGYGSTLRTDELDNTLFHELGHGVHYRQVGASFWKTYIGYIVTAFTRGRSSTYGRKTDEGAGLIAVSEAWGTYIGNTFSVRKYDGIDQTIGNARRDRLENQIPNDDVNDDDGWIVYGMLHDMTDNTEPTFTGVTDNVNTYTTAQILRALQPSVVSVRGYQQRVLQQNNNRQAAEMEQLVTSYRWPL